MIRRILLLVGISLLALPLAQVAQPHGTPSHHEAGCRPFRG